ncbi:MAG: prenyltransferase/squalene oxidase repeat-containing protein [Candidatus Thorarchaeota archaeon]|jgi:prenyltransferase beta subunit
MKKVQVATLAIAFVLVAVAFISIPVAANPDTRWDTLSAYMTENYDSAVEGGFTLPEAEASRLYPTFGAATVYEEMGQLALRPPVIDLVKMKNFTRKLQWKSGGEDYDRYGGFSLFIAGSVGMDNTYYGVKLWQLLTADSYDDIPGINNLELINTTSALLYVNRTQSVDGGFGVNEDEAPNIVSTFHALYVMDYMLENSNEVQETWLWNETATIEWILSCREGDAFKLSPTSNIASVTATAAGLMALDVLGQLNVVPIEDRQAILDWVADLQDEDASDGGVGGFAESVLTNDTNLLSTYHALEIYTLLGGLTNIDSDAAARFILDCQAADGSWATVAGLEVGTLFFAGLALDALRMLDISGTYVDMIYEEDPNNPGEPLVDWRLLFVAVFIVAALVIALIALRMD